MSPGARRSSQATSSAVKPGAPSGAAATTIRSNGSRSSSPSSAWRYAAAALDAAVDRDAGRARALLDGLQQRQRHLALAGQRRVEGQVQRYGREVGGNERGVLGAREPQRRLERRPRERGPDDREQDPGAAGHAGARGAGGR